MPTTSRLQDAQTVLKQRETNLLANATALKAKMNAETAVIATAAAGRCNNAFKTLVFIFSAGETFVRKVVGCKNPQNCCSCFSKTCFKS